MLSQIKNTSKLFLTYHPVYKPMAGYGYDIFYNNNLLIHQNNNPFTGSPMVENKRR
jgi:hypothetical protein